jgi:GDP-L-fucose synthase
MNPDSRIYVAGHRGLVGSAIQRELLSRGFRNIIVRAHAQLDLRDALAVQKLFREQKPEYVVLAAAKVGGILANQTYPASFIHENLAIQNNVIEVSRQTNVNRLLFLGSSCIYPRLCPQPIREEYLLTGALEPTNRPYAVAKIAGIEMCWSYNRQYGTKYLAAMPTNLYGPNDNFDLDNSHVLPALLRKITEARSNGDSEAVVWGTGSPRRELLYSRDMAEACLFLLELNDTDYDSLLSPEQAPLINIGTGHDISIRELAEQICAMVGYGGELRYDTSKPDGTPRKLLDISKMSKLGWTAKTSLEEGIRLTYGAMRPLLQVSGQVV